jgi:putative adenylate-forming enzyme
MIDKAIILAHYLQAKYRSPFHTRQELEVWQERHVQQHLRKVLNLSPFYRQYYQGLKLQAWRDFPLIEKQIMMKNFDSLNTVGIRSEDAFQIAFQSEESRDFSPQISGVSVGLSSGTSGNRGLFLVSRKERLRWAGTILAKVLPAPLWAGQKVAFFLRANNNLYQTVNSRLVQFQFYDLLEPMPLQIRRLNNYQPSILAAPPSALRMLALAVKSNDLKIKPVKVISIAEVLEPCDRIFISEQFQQRIHQVYQCTEGFLGVTCSHGTIHLNEDLVVIQKEYIDKQQRRFIPVITDFYRTTQPVIRYRLNDILVESSTPCPCGSVFTALEKIEGRCDDIFYLYSSSCAKLIPVFPDFLRRAVLQASAEITEYCVIQHHPDLIEVLVKTPNEVRLRVRRELNKTLNRLFTDFGCKLPQITYTTLSEQRDFRKKQRRIERKFKLEDEESGII